MKQLNSALFIILSIISQYALAELSAVEGTQNQQSLTITAVQQSAQPSLAEHEVRWAEEKMGVVNRDIGRSVCHSAVIEFANRTVLVSVRNGEIYDWLSLETEQGRESLRSLASAANLKFIDRKNTSLPQEQFMNSSRDIWEPIALQWLGSPERRAKTCSRAAPSV